MQETITVEIPKVEAAQVQAQREVHLSRIRQTQPLMANEQIEMDRLKAETRRNLAEIKRLMMLRFTEAATARSLDDNAGARFRHN